MQISAPGLKNILAWGRKLNDYSKTDKRDRQPLE
jgi:hypothetical protein